MASVQVRQITLLQLIDAGDQIMNELRNLVDEEDEEQANRVIPKICSWVLAVDGLDL